MLNYHRIKKHRSDLSPANGGIFFVIFLCEKKQKESFLKKLVNPFYISTFKPPKKSTLNTIFHINSNEYSQFKKENT
jgi:hypothetical protein